MTNKTKHVKEPLVHLTRRLNVSAKYAWAIRIGAFLLSILVCGIVSTMMSDKVHLGFFFKCFFKGTFGTVRLTWVFLRDMAILLLLALAVTPCFKMRFWNIGGEGQTMMGAFGAAVVVNQLYGRMPLAVVILLALVVAMGFGVVWAVIPALFKAKWNTNETLLTLMVNYIAICLGAFFIKKVDPNGTGILSFMKQLDGVGKLGNEFLLIILIAAVVTALMAVYLKYSKHGYEIAVVGESPNTAKYIGINTKVVIIRTLVLCGVLCGLVGFILVVIKDHSFLSSSASESTVAGKGFTAILISWLAHFNPVAMVLASFCVVFISRGAINVSLYTRMGDSYPSVMVGIFFFFIIATEFFINFKINFRAKASAVKTPEDTPPRLEAAPVEEAETVAAVDEQTAEGAETPEAKPVVDQQ